MGAQQERLLVEGDRFPAELAAVHQMGGIYSTLGELALLIPRDVGELIANQIVDDPAKSPVYELAFTNFRPTIPPAEQARLQKEALELLRSGVLPALRKLHTFWKTEYEPKTREAISWTKIKELRAKAQRELGDQFDVRAFHDAVLGQGPLPLSLLETRMNDWVRGRKGGAKATITLTR